MASKQQQRAKDRTSGIVRDNLARIKLIAVAGTAFCDSRQKEQELGCRRVPDVTGASGE
jgi:hypothetical protein